MLRTRSRAVTAEDFELLTREAAPEVARVRCIPAQTAEDAGHVTVCIVPAAARAERCAAVRGPAADRAHAGGDRRAARGCRIIGSVVHVEPPTSTKASPSVARLRGAPRADPERVRADAVAAFTATSIRSSAGRRQGLAVGPPGTIGRRVQRAATDPGRRRRRGRAAVRCQPGHGERGEATTRLELPPTASSSPTSTKSGWSRRESKRCAVTARARRSVFRSRSR